MAHGGGHGGGGGGGGHHGGGFGGFHRRSGWGWGPGWLVVESVELCPAGYSAVVEQDGTIVCIPPSEAHGLEAGDLSAGSVFGLNLASLAVGAVIGYAIAETMRR